MLPLIAQPKQSLTTSALTHNLSHLISSPRNLPIFLVLSPLLEIFLLLSPHGEESSNLPCLISSPCLYSRVGLISSRRGIFQSSSPLISSPRNLPHLSSHVGMKLIANTFLGCRIRVLSTWDESYKKNKEHYFGCRIHVFCLESIDISLFSSIY